MLCSSNKNDLSRMMNYYRTSEMLNLKKFFPNVSPIQEIVIVESIDEYLKNRDYFEGFNYNEVDTLKGRKFISDIQSNGKNINFYDILLRVKNLDPLGVLVLFNIKYIPSERYERWAGVNVNIILEDGVIIEAVSKGFDGMEVSHGICCHERYYIPWFDIRKLSVDNFNNYRTFLIGQEEYEKTRNNRVKFLNSLSLNEEVFDLYIPKLYQEIPVFIWRDIINNIIKKLEKNEELFKFLGFDNFVISGHCEGNKFAPWKMYNKERFTLYKKL